MSADRLPCGCVLLPALAVWAPIIAAVWWLVG